MQPKFEKSCEPLKKLNKGDKLIAEAQKADIAFEALEKEPSVSRLSALKQYFSKFKDAALNVAKEYSSGSKPDVKISKLIVNVVKSIGPTLAEADRIVEEAKGVEKKAAAALELHIGLRKDVLSKLSGIERKIHKESGVIKQLITKSANLDAETPSPTVLSFVKVINRRLDLVSAYREQIKTLIVDVREPSRQLKEAFKLIDPDTKLKKIALPLTNPIFEKNKKLIGDIVQMETSVKEVITKCNELHL